MAQFLNQSVNFRTLNDVSGDDFMRSNLCIFTALCVVEDVQDMAGTPLNVCKSKVDVCVVD